MKKSVANWFIAIMVSFILVSCSSVSEKPEAVLWGNWKYLSSENGNDVFAHDIEFLIDGTLLISENSSSEMNSQQFSIIAPGRMKITEQGQSKIVSFEVSDDTLKIYFEDGYNLYTVDNGGVERSSQIPSPFQDLPTSTSEKIVFEPTFTATLILPTNTPFWPTSTSTNQKPMATLTQEGVLVIDTKKNAIDSMMMVFIPVGEFLMGSDPETDPYYWGAEGPSHKVYVDSFWIYQTEVTNAMYQACVEDKGCPRPLRNESRMVQDYYTNPNYANYPVIQVSWVYADAYCKWAGGRLPREAEWEKAARGVDGRLFPWGNDGINANLASFCGTNCPEAIREKVDDGFREIAPVGSFPEGASPYGALDMAGNVWEWVFDYFSTGFYQIAPYDNPKGPLSGSRRVIRGGSWGNPLSGLRTVARTSIPPSDGLDTIGFRCVLVNDY